MVDISVQASVGDLSVGLYAWARNLLPIVISKSGNPQSRDLVLQLVEKYENIVTLSFIYIYIPNSSLLLSSPWCFL